MQKEVQECSMNVMNMNKEVLECSDSYLPEELWELISKKVNTRIGIVRFRSICSLWRSFLPLPPSPPPTSPDLCILHTKYFLLQTKIYRIQPCSSSSNNNNKGWIIKVFQHSKSSKFYLYDLFTNRRLRNEEDTTEFFLNLMNYRVVKLFELYSESYHIDNDYVCNVCKVILFSTHDGRRMVFANHDKEIKVSYIGEEMDDITLKDDGGEIYYFDDIIHYKRQVYVVDNMGTIFWINTLSLKLVQFSPKNMNCCVVNNNNNHIRVISDFNKKHLVEYDGNLYVVDLFINDTMYYKRGFFLKAVFVEVYKLDQEWGRWLQVKDLGDVSFVLGRDSNFVLLAQDYYGCEGNCIYFYHHESKVSCFNLKTSVSKPADMFWPAPTLFHPVAG